MGVLGRQYAAMFVCVIALFFGAGAFVGSSMKMDPSMIEWCKSIANGLIYAALTALQLSNGARKTDGNGNGASEVKNSITK